jgi:hypothetical protein
MLILSVLSRANLSGKYSSSLKNLPEQNTLAYYATGFSAKKSFTAWIQNDLIFFVFKNLKNVTKC